MPEHPESERPEVFYEVSTAGFDVVEKPLSAWEKLYDNGAVPEDGVTGDPGAGVGTVRPLAQ